jgi:Astacin (Peptidase family M12A)
MAKKIIRTCIDQIVQERSGGPLGLAGLTESLWEPGQTLHVRFMDGDPRIQAKVEGVARQWSLYANIQFVFDNTPNAQIRISFTPDGTSWSYIGQKVAKIPRNQPTMNYGWLTLNTADNEYERVVLHEFGHALGCIHEHQNPSTNIPWNKPAVYRYYAQRGWNQARVDNNLFATYGVNQTQFTRFDEKSIMLYPIPKELTDGIYEVGWNRALSDTDRSYIASLYPFSGPRGTVLQVGAAPLQADLQPAEVHVYRFQVGTAGDYTIETSGRTDVVMSLFGPDERATKMAEDDDSGPGLNPSITTRLVPATYYVEIRHYRKTGKGKYAITVRNTA